MPDIPETHHDLLNASFATLATVGASGRPQLSTVYFLASADGTVQLSENATRQKAKNIVADPKVALHIQDTVEYVRYLELRGDATVEPDDDYAFADRLGAKYGGVDLRNMDRPGERRTVVTINLTRVRAVRHAPARQRRFNAEALTAVDYEPAVAFRVACVRGVGWRVRQRRATGQSGRLG